MIKNDDDSITMKENKLEIFSQYGLFIKNLQKKKQAYPSVSIFYKKE